MQEVKDRLAGFVPRLKTAVNDIETFEGLADWCQPFVAEIGALCLVGYRVEVKKLYDPQEEESKEEATFEQAVTGYIRQFDEFVTDIQGGFKTQIGKLKFKLDSVKGDQKSDSIIPKLQNNRYATKYQQVDKKCKSYISNEEFIKILTDSIVQQEEELQEITDHRQQVVK